MKPLAEDSDHKFGPGRKRKYGQQYRPLVSVSAKVEPETRERIDVLAKTLGLSRSDFLDRLIKDAVFPRKLLQ